MPSITQWSALGGLGKAAGQSLQELIAQRFAEQKQRELVADQEADRAQRQAEAEALEAHRQALLAQGDRTYQQTERTYTEGAPLRLLNTRKLEADLAAKAKEDAEVAESVAAMRDPGFDQLPLAQRQYHYARATRGQTPSAGMLLTPEERQRQLEETEGPGSPKTRSAIAVEDVRERNRPPSPDPNAPPKPTEGEREVPPELSEILVGLAQNAPSLEVARQFVEQNKAKISADFPTANFLAVDRELTAYFKSVPRKQRTGIEAINEALYGAPPAPAYTYPGKRKPAVPGEVPTPTPTPAPAVNDPALEILRQRGLVQ